MGKKKRGKEKKRKRKKKKERKKKEKRKKERKKGGIGKRGEKRLSLLYIDVKLNRSAGT